MMLERPGAVVTRDELRRRLWPDGTFVDFEHSLNAAVKRLRAALGDDADNPRFVETLPRRGYRFIGALGAEGSDKACESVPRVAVLPFSNLSDEGSQEYFTDGLTEEMIAQLGQRCRGRIGVDRALVIDGLQEQHAALARDWAGAARELPARGQRPPRGRSGTGHRKPGRDRQRDASLVRNLRAPPHRLPPGAVRYRRAHCRVAGPGAGS